jgi:DNA polymerase III gamma/tau subunit
MSEKAIINEHRPALFKDYVGQGNNTSGDVDFLKELISKNLHHKSRAILIEGPSGCGKTTLAQLYYKATLCHNRKAGDYEPCGKCNVCTGQDTSNVYHYTISTVSQARDHVDKLIKQSYTMPMKFSEREDQYRQFIVVDEAELATPEFLSIFFDPLENSPKYTTWIIITMDLEKLKTRDAIKADALISRCTVLSLNALTQSQISQKILDNYPSLNQSVADIIALNCKGNLRMAWNTLSKLQSVKPIEEIDENFVYQNLFGGATPESRHILWNALKNSKAEILLKTLKQWLNKGNNPKELCNLLIGDIVDNLIGRNPESQALLTLLGRWMSSNHPYSLESILISQLGCNIYATSNDKTNEDFSSALSEQSLDNKQSLPLFFTSKLSKYYESISN